MTQVTVAQKNESINAVNVKLEMSVLWVGMDMALDIRNEAMVAGNMGKVAEYNAKIAAIRPKLEALMDAAN
jgi:hypothetical protein